MPESKLVFVPFWYSDFLAAVASMPLMERGVYITALCLQWELKRGIRKAELEQACGRKGAVISKILDDKFEVDSEGFYWNLKAKSVIEDAGARRKRAQDAAEKRWADSDAKPDAKGDAKTDAKGNAKGNAKPDAKGNAKGNAKAIQPKPKPNTIKGTIQLAPSQSPPEKASPQTRAAQHAGRFARFWDAFDYKQGKKNAEIAFAAAIKRIGKRGLTPDQATEKLCLAARAYCWYLANHPNPPKRKWAQGWLNDERYEDDYESLLEKDLQACGEIGPRGREARTANAMQQFVERRNSSPPRIDGGSLL